MGAQSQRAATARPVAKDWKDLAPRKVFSSPHIFTRRSSAQIMWLVSACLLPAALWAIWLFGWHALRVLLLSILSCIATEASFNLIFSRRRNLLYLNKIQRIQWTLDDGSAVLSGLLLGMNLSPLVPSYIPIFGGIFAMAICKWSFGGLGANWVNPALAGRAFVFFSFGREMASWPKPAHVLQDNAMTNFDAETVASPLGIFKEQLLLAQASAPDDTAGGALQNWSNGMQLDGAEGLWNLLWGFQPGSTGEVATLFLLLGGLALWGMRIISWHIPLAFLGSFALLTWIFGGLYLGHGLFKGEVLFHLLSGGLMLGSWFMATDYSSCPKMPSGKFIFGLGCGLLTFLIRFYGSYPEGVMLAILFMNIWTPTIDILIRPRIFGSGKRGPRSQKDERRSVLNLPSY